MKDARAGVAARRELARLGWTRALDALDALDAEED
jgi:hypothetical protein